MEIIKCILNDSELFADYFNDIELSSDIWMNVTQPTASRGINGRETGNKNMLIFGPFIILWFWSRREFK